ncbi:MAG TPA: hypothetical protein VF070_35245 [Streptosporangiaceae bacterium]
MTITYVKGTAASSATRLTDKTFDIMGTALVYEDEFRKFDSADGSWPIVFRSDTRPYSEIFGKGFQPRKDAADKYLDDRRLTRPASVALRLGNVDLDTDTAVCVSLLPEMTVLFPFDVQKDFGEQDVNVYICQVKSWLEVYAVQDALAPRLAYAKEVASTGIDPMDVLGCFAVHRKWRRNGVTFEVASMDSNPAGRRSVPDSVRAFAAPGARSVDAPGFLEEKAYGSATGEVVFGYVKSMIGELKGDSGTNRVQNSQIAGLKATNPLKAATTGKPDQKRRLSN